MAKLDMELLKPVLFVMAVLLISGVAARFKNVGAVGKLMPPDEKIAGIVDAIKPDLKKRFPGEYESIEIINYKSQLVQGRLYFVKIRVVEKGSSVSYAHLRIHVPLRGQGEPYLDIIRADMPESQEIDYFT